MIRCVCAIVCVIAVLFPSQSDAVIFTDDGIIQDGDKYQDVLIYDDATVHMFGGAVSNDLAVFGTFNLFGGTTTDIFNHGSVNVYGGEIDYMGGNYAGGTYSIMMNIYGGIIREGLGIGVGRFATLNIYGGDINTRLSIATDPEASANIYGYAFQYDPDSAILTGFLADDNPFTLTEVDAAEYDHLNLYTIPEPGTVLLLGLGVVMLRRKH